MCFQRSSGGIVGKSRPPRSGWKIVPQSRTGCRETTAHILITIIIRLATRLQSISALFAVTMTDILSRGSIFLNTFWAPMYGAIIDRVARQGCVCPCWPGLSGPDVLTGPVWYTCLRRRRREIYRRHGRTQRSSIYNRLIHACAVLRQ